MKKSFMLSGLCILFAGFLFLSAGAQQSGPFHLAVFEETVAPSDMAAFYKAQQQAVELWKKHNLDIPVYCYGTSDNIFYWVVPIQNFASLDAVFEKTGAFMKKAKEQDGFDGDKTFRDLSTSRASVITWSPEMSNKLSGTGRLDPNKNYLEWSFFSVKSGHEKELAAVAKKYIDFYKRIGENYEWDIYSVSFGYEMPMMIMITQAENPLAMRQQEAKIFEKNSKELGELWGELSAHLRKVEKKTGWFMGDWSINTAQ